MARRIASLLVCVGIWMSAGQAADAAIGGVVVSPIVAPIGSTVTVAGNGCAVDVHVTATGYLFPGPPATVADTIAHPAADGTWSTTFPMPAVPAYVLAECGGATPAPIVIAPSDGALGSLAPAAVSSSSVVISTSPLVNGSRFAVFDATGAMLASAVVAGGVGTVSVPRSLGPARVIAVGLRQPDPGIALPDVPIAAFVQLPLPATTSIVVQPSVTAAGTTVTASGRCSGSARLRVLGRVQGWYDHAPVLVDMSPAVNGGHEWRASFPMPSLPSIAELSCSAAGVVDVASARISPAAGDLPSLVPFAIDGDVGVTLPSQAEPDSLRAYTAAGAVVPMTITTDGTTPVARLRPPSRPIRIVIVGIEMLGENAEALQNSRVQAWTVDVAAATGSPEPAPATPIPLPATDVAATPSPIRSDRWLTVAAVLLLAILPLTVAPRRSRRARTAERKD